MNRAMSEGVLNYVGGGWRESSATDTLALTSDPARRKIAADVAAAVDQVFEVEEKPVQIGHG